MEEKKKEKEDVVEVDEEWIQGLAKVNFKVTCIIRGLPGAGKTTLAKKIR